MCLKILTFLKSEKPGKFTVLNFNIRMLSVYFSKQSASALKIMVKTTIF